MSQQPNQSYGQYSNQGAAQKPPGAPGGQYPPPGSTPFGGQSGFPQQGGYGGQPGQFGQPGNQPGQFGQPGGQPSQYGQPGGQYGQQPGQYGQPGGQFGQQPGGLGQPGQFGQQGGSPYGQPQGGSPYPQHGQPTSQYGQPGNQYGQGGQPGQFGQPGGQQGGQFGQQGNQPGQYGQPGGQFGQQPGQFGQQGGQPGQYGQPGGQQGGQFSQQGGQPGQQQSNWGAQMYNQINPQEMGLYQAWFQSVDTDHSGNITAQELAGLTLAGKPLGLPAAKKLIKVFDKNYSGSIDFQEYASLHQFLNKMMGAFYQADTDRSGQLEAGEILQALQSAGFQLSLQTVQGVTSKFVTGTNKGVNFEQFLQVCAHLATVRSIFEWNDTAKTGKVTLTYDQLSHITVHLMDQ
eukprot:TRINITY_DN559_c0_g1_i2.p1 TRINITY_DN559_c0_g1~~TRINITY_DN559_c0_g1_i2.p1  ORF type:complete len:403 (+),score=169.07 TRINITY_DN559_c0_g1_i2:112-1320(+)